MAFPQLVRGEVHGLVNNVALIVFVPIIGDHAFLAQHLIPSQRPRVRGENGIGTHIVTGSDIELSGLLKYGTVVSIEAKHEKTENQDTVTLDLFDQRLEGLRAVLILVNAFQNPPGDGLKADTEKVAAAFDLPYYKIETCDEVDEKIMEVINTNGPVFVDVVCDRDQTLIES